MTVNDLPEWKAQKTYSQNLADSRIKGTLPPLTPEEEKRIDSSDPAGNARRFLHKLVGNGGQPHPS